MPRAGPQLQLGWGLPGWRVGGTEAPWLRLYALSFATCGQRSVPAVILGLQVMMGPMPLAGVGVSRCGPHPWALVRLSPGRASLHDKASLRLEQVRSEDQGWYECKVLMLDQQYDTFHNGSWVHLTINGEYGSPPRLGARRSLFSGGTHR